MFSIRITSNCFGFKIICMAALSTNKKSNAIVGYSLATSPTTLRHNLELSKTFALSIRVTFLSLFRAALKAKCAILSISNLLYWHKSEAVFPSSLRFFSPK